jgi:diguanylate cyclase (GGDEF)-like protein
MNYQHFAGIFDKNIYNCNRNCDHRRINFLDKTFETAWIERFNFLSDKRNRTVALVALITGTALIIPDVMLTANYSSSLLILRIFASSIGFLGYFLFLMNKMNNRTMVLFYALPVFSISSYMVALMSDTSSITQMHTTMAVAGIFFIALFILKMSTWIIICVVLYLSYFISIVLLGQLPLSEYLVHGGSLVIIGFLTFPLVARIKYRMMKENFMLSYEVQRQKEELEFYANNDILTEAFNRRGGIKILEQTMSISRRHKIPLSISFIDINGLKKVNDEHGHASGDILIKTIAQLIKENIRKSDSLFRFGGDEFVIIFPGCSLEENKHIMLKIRKAAADYRSEDTEEFNIAFSYGLSEFTEDMSVDDFIKSADKEMYIDKG